MATARSARADEYTALLRRPGYPGFVLTVSLTRITTAMFTTSGVLLVLARTGSAGLAGLTAAAAVLPRAFTGPLLGAWLDVARRRRVLIVSDQLLGAVALVGLVALAGHAPDWTVPAAAVLLGLTAPLSTGSFMSALAEVAGDDLLDRASTIEATSLNLGFVIGPAMGGVLAGTVGAGVAVELQAGLTLAAAGLIAINPVFDARAQTHATSVRAAMRDGTRALVRHRLLRDISIASMLGSLSWSLMSVGFPLYAMRELHAGAHAGGYLWAAVAIGSILGTFVLEGAPTPRRVAVSYGVLGLSALLWPLAGTLAIGFALITLTGFLEGPAYSGTVALRQRHVPPTVRAQAFNTLNSLGGIAVALGAAAGGLLHRPLTTVIAFAAVNAVAAAIALHAAGTVRIPDTRAHG